MRYLFILSVLISLNTVTAQLSGVITDTKGIPLPSASIYISGTTIGVNSNTNGEYFLNVPAGESEIIFQYIGYTSQRKKIRNTGLPLKIDIRMEIQTLDISEIEIKADAEDPAYRIIRNSIAKREFYRKKIKSYSCDVYIKGNQKIVKIPQKLFGQEIGTLDGILDTNRQGIVYLSESVSKFYFSEPDKIREELISSKVSGNSRGFSFNRAREMRFNLYDPSINFGKQIISPIASGALLFYKYKFEGSFFDQDGNEINKIQVIPRNENDPLFRGDIMIYENSWNIHSCNLGITGKTIKNEILDTLWLKQQYVPGKNVDEWLLLSQSLDFKIGFIGIALKGYFTAVYSNYEVNKDFSRDFFSDEILSIQPESNKKDKAYWDAVRPVPLLKEEGMDFTKKDSLEIIWNSKAFKDSTDRKNNKFTSNSMLFGYTYRNSFRRLSVEIGSPLSTIQFDPVRGFYTTLAAKIKKERDEDATSWFSVSPELNYGFSEQKLRGSIEVQRLFNRISYDKIKFKLGISAEQYNSQNPISATINGLYNLYAKENFLKSYEKEFIGASWNRKISSNIAVTTEAEYMQRSVLNNTTNYSFKKQDTDYSPNYPGDTTGSFVRHSALSYKISLLFTPGQKYVSYPRYRIYLPSRYPEIGFNYMLTSVFYKKSQKENYTIHRPEISLKYSFKPRFIGTTDISIQAGTTFLSGSNPEFVDYMHFNGNQTFLSSARGSVNAFRLLPYYDFSTTGNYSVCHVNHNFEGVLLSKIPLIKNLKLEENIGIKILLQENNFKYYEYSVGISNIGWSIFRLFRVDYSWSLQNSKFLKQGITIGISLP